MIKTVLSFSLQTGIIWHKAPKYPRHKTKRVIEQTRIVIPAAMQIFRENLALSFQPSETVYRN